MRALRRVAPRDVVPAHPIPPERRAGGGNPLPEKLAG